MVSLVIALTRFWFAIRTAWRDPSFRLLVALTASLLLVGTWVFHRVEGWSYLDSFYFSAISLSTVGYGDFTPHTPVGKLLTVFYIFAGFGLLVALLTLFANALIQSVQESRAKLHLQLMGAHEKEVAGGTAKPDPDESLVAHEQQKRPNESRESNIP